MKSKKVDSILLITLLLLTPTLIVSGKADQSQGNPFDEILSAIDELGSISFDIEPILQAISDAVAALTSSIETSRDSIIGLIEDTQTETIDEIQYAITESEQETATAIDEAKDEAMNTMMTASRLFELSYIDGLNHPASLEISVSCDKPFIIRSIQLGSTCGLQVQPTLEIELQLDATSYWSKIFSNYDLIHGSEYSVWYFDVFYAYGIYDGISCMSGTTFVINDNFRVPSAVPEDYGVYVIIESALNATPSLTVELGPW